MSERSTHVAFLRGINVGGKHLLPMKELGQLFQEAGCEGVRTHLQTGNVLFRASAAQAKKVPAVVAQAIEERYGFPVPVLLRSIAELRKAVEVYPFMEGGADPARLHVAFLEKKPTASKVAALDPARSPGDSFQVLGQEIHLYCPNGLARTKLTNAYFDGILGTVSTVRTRKTVLRLIELARG